jgi:hypothetical protein
VGITVKEICRRQYNKELMQLFGDLDILSSVRISQLKRTGQINRMDSKKAAINR